MSSYRNSNLGLFAHYPAVLSNWPGDHAAASGAGRAAAGPPGWQCYRIAERDACAGREDADPPGDVTGRSGSPRCQA